MPPLKTAPQACISGACSPGATRARALEHQVLEQVGQPGPARCLMPGSDVVVEMDGGGGGGVVLAGHHAQAVAELVLGNGIGQCQDSSFPVMAACRARRPRNRGGITGDGPAARSPAASGIRQCGERSADGGNAGMAGRQYRERFLVAGAGLAVVPGLGGDRREGFQDLGAGTAARPGCPSRPGPRAAGAGPGRAGMPARGRARPWRGPGCRDPAARPEAPPASRKTVPAS